VKSGLATKRAAALKQTPFAHYSPTDNSLSLPLRIDLSCESIAILSVNKLSNDQDESANR
jgi:hypothetical protein